MLCALLSKEDIIISSIDFVFMPFKHYFLLMVASTKRFKKNKSLYNKEGPVSLWCYSSTKIVLVYVAYFLRYHLWRCLPSFQYNEIQKEATMSFFRNHEKTIQRPCGLWRNYFLSALRLKACIYLLIRHRTQWTTSVFFVQIIIWFHTEENAHIATVDKM